MHINATQALEAEVRAPAAEYPRGRHAMVMRLKEEEYFKTFSVTGPSAA